MRTRLFCLVLLLIQSFPLLSENKPQPKPSLTLVEAAKVAEAFLTKANLGPECYLRSITLQTPLKNPRDRVSLERDIFYEVDYGSPSNSNFALNGPFVSGVREYLRVDMDRTARFVKIPWNRLSKEAEGSKKAQQRPRTPEELKLEAESIAAGKGVPYQDTVLRDLSEQFEQRENILKELVGIQLDLSPDQADRFLNGWAAWKAGDEFLPLIRKMVEAPYYNSAALRVLSELRPEEAKPLILEDVRKETPLFLTTKGSYGYGEQAYLSLPKAPIPELDPVLREAFRESKGDMYLMTKLLERYGSDSLLADVKKWYVPKEGRWGCEIQAAVLRFWIQREPKEGLEALERVVKLRGEPYTRCYSSALTDVLLKNWNEAALPLLGRALKDPDGEVVVSAVTALAAHGDAKWLERCIEALEKAPRLLTPEERAKGNLDLISGMADRLIENERWKPNEAQVERLKKVYRPGI